jgi:hypothetical protein
VPERLFNQRQRVSHNPDSFEALSECQDTESMPAIGAFGMFQPILPGL